MPHREIESYGARYVAAAGGFVQRITPRWSRTSVMGKILIKICRVERVRVLIEMKRWWDLPLRADFRSLRPWTALIKWETSGG